MRDGLFPKKKGLYVISVIGEDRVGIVAKVTSFFLKMGIPLSTSNKRLFTLSSRWFFLFGR